MIETPLIIHISTYIIAVPAIAGAVMWKQLTQVQRELAEVVWGIAIIQVIALFLGHYTERGNMPLYHLYVPVEFSLLLWLYRHLLHRWLADAALIALGLAFWMLAATNAFIVDSLDDFPSIARTAEGVVFTALPVLYFFVTMKDSANVRLERTPFFWMSAGQIIYFASNLMLFVYANYIAQQSDAIFDATWFVHAGLNILLYLTYTTALLCRIQNNK